MDIGILHFGDTIEYFKLTKTRQASDTPERRAQRGAVYQVGESLLRNAWPDDYFTSWISQAPVPEGKSLDMEKVLLLAYLHAQAKRENKTPDEVFWKMYNDLRETGTVKNPHKIFYVPETKEIALVIVSTPETPQAAGLRIFKRGALKKGKSMAQVVLEAMRNPNIDAMEKALMGEGVK